MTAGKSGSASHIEQLLRKLRRELSPETDLWPRIAACIDTKTEHRIRQLRRDIEAPRDLWPPIHARLSRRQRLHPTGPASASPTFRIALAAGLLALATLAFLFSTRVRDFNEAEVKTASAIDPDAPAAAADPPAWLTGMLEPFTEAAPGTPGAPLRETALSIQRDFVMLSSERLYIEQAMARSADDMNLRAQWRQVYGAELRLIDEAAKLGTIYRARSTI